MKAFIRIVIIALSLIFITSLVSLVYGHITSDGLNLRIMFNANFLVGAIIIGAAMALVFPLTRLFKFDQLTDHSTLTERHKEMREQKRKKGYEFLFIGILVIVITGLVQLVLTMSPWPGE